MPVGACGVSCDVCGLYVKGICRPCAAGTDEGAKEKLDGQMQRMGMHCPILACAVERKISYCLRDCSDFPCSKFESGFESTQGPGPYPYSSSYLNMFRRRLGKK